MVEGPVKKISSAEIINAAKAMKSGPSVLNFEMIAESSHVGEE